MKGCPSLSDKSWGHNVGGDKVLIEALSNAVEGEIQ